MSGDKLHTFPLFTEAEIEASPSRRDGVDARKENAIWRKVNKAIFEATKEIQMSAGTSSIAITFLMRFFCLRSLLKNDPVLIAVAALYLAGKCNNEPRAVPVALSALFKQYYGRGNPELISRLSQPQNFQVLVEKVLDAELALMFALNFDFNVDIFPTTASRLFKTPLQHCLKDVIGNRAFQQFVVASGNTIMQRDAKMVLQFTNEDICLAIFQLYFKTKGIPEPPPNPETGQPWFVKYGLSEEISSQIFSRFTSVVFNVQKNGADSAAGGTVALGGTQTSTSFGGDVGDGGGTKSTAAPPPPLENRKQGPDASSLGQKRARSWEDVHQMHYGRPSGVGAVPAGWGQASSQQHLPLPAANKNDDDSEPEEGEIV